MRLKHLDLVVAAAIVVSSPMAPGIVNGSIGATTALTRFLIALIGCAVAGDILQRVLSGYREQARRSQILAQLAQARQRTYGGQLADGALPGPRPAAAGPAAAGDGASQGSGRHGVVPPPSDGPAAPGGARS